MPRYQIERPIKLTQGVVELEESVAASLVQSKALTLIDDQTNSDTDQGKPTVNDSSSEPSTVDNRSVEDIKLDKIVELIGNLDLQDEAVMTKSGKPDSNVLTEMLHDNVSAQERDVAWSEFQAKSTENQGAE